MENESGAYAEIIVRFGEDTAVLTFPYLGQATYMGHIETLLEGSGAPLPRHFIPICASPEVKEYMDRQIEEGKLAEAASKPIPIAVSGIQFDTARGLLMCGAIKRALKSPKAEKAGVSGIASELTQEMEALSDLLSGAGYRGLQFTLELQECVTPPAALIQWRMTEMAELGKWLGDIMDQVEKENGGKS